MVVSAPSIILKLSVSSSSFTRALWLTYPQKDAPSRPRRCLPGPERRAGARRRRNSCLSSARCTRSRVRPAQPRALVGNARAAEGHELAPAHNGIEANYAVAALSLYAGVRGDRSGRPLNVHAAPGGPVFTTLALCSVVYVDQKLTNKRLDRHALDGQTRARYANDIWYRVALPGTAQGDGYVVGWGDPSAPAASFVPSYLDFRTPDPASTLYHCTTPGEGALGIVARHYRLSDDVRRLRGDAYADLRFYVNVLSYLNPLSVPSPDPGGLDTATWERTRVIRKDDLWIPSRTFADTLKGKVGSGSSTHGGWGRFSADLRANWAAAEAEANEALDGLGALVALPVLGAGIVAGAATEGWDTLTGLLEAPAAVVGLVQELFSGQLFGLLQGLWDELTAKGGIAALVGTLFGPLEREWNDADFFKRWFFRGTIIGGAVAFLALTFFSDGIVAALKGLSLTAKLADAIRGLEAAQGFVAAGRAARETAAGRAVWQAFTVRGLSGSLGAGTLGALLKQRMALQDIKALVDGLGPAAVKALVGQGAAGRDILAVAGKIGGATVAKLVAGKMSFADIRYLASKFDAVVVQGLTIAAAKDLRAAAILGDKITTTLLHGLSPQDIENLAIGLGRNAIDKLIRGGLSPRAIKDLADTFGGAEVQRLLGTKTAPQLQALRQGLLAATANPAQLTRLLAFAKGDALLVDRLLKDIGRAADLERFVTQLRDDAAGFEKAMHFFGGAIEIRKIMVAAATVAIDPASLLDSQMLAKVQVTVASGQSFAQDTISVGGYKYVVGVDLNVNRLTQFFPTTGIPIPQDVLKAIKTILGKT